MGKPSDDFISKYKKTVINDINIWAAVDVEPENPATEITIDLEKFLLASYLKTEGIRSVILTD